MASDTEVIWQPRAKSQLYKIVEFYNKRNGSTTYSERLLSKIDHRLSLVGDDWQLGEKVSRKNIRRTTVEYFVIHYLITPVSVEVLSIRDARRKPKRFKWNE